MSHKFLNINWDLINKKFSESNQNLKENTQKNDTTTTTVTKDKTLTYFLPPPIVNTSFIYQDINKDQLLRKRITDFFLKKTIKWINKYSEFEKTKHILPKLKEYSGYKIIYNILRQFVKKNKCNWYDLRNNYELVKDFIRYKLNKHS